MATFWIRTAKKRAPINRALIKSAAGAGAASPSPCCCLTSPPGTRTCEGADPGSPASAPQQEFNPYLPKSAGSKGRRGERMWPPLYQPRRAEERGAAPWLGHSLAGSVLLPTRGCSPKTPRESSAPGPETALKAAECSSQQAMPTV